MISRRDALKLGAVGFVAPSLGASDSGPALASATQEQSGSVPMFRGNPARTGAMPGPGPSLDKPIVVKWKYDSGLSGSDIKAQAWAVTDEIIFCGVAYYSDWTLVALNAITGTMEWSVPLGRDSGARTPAFWGVHDGVVLVSEFTPEGDFSREVNVVALDATSGVEHWRFLSGTSVPSVEIKNGCVLVSNDETQILINLISGQTQLEDVQFLVSEGDFILVGTRERFVALEANSSAKLWEVPMTVGEPIVVNGTIYAKGYGPALCAIDIHTGSILWQFDTDDGIVSFKYDDGMIYLSGSSNTYALDASSGSEQWRYKIEQPDMQIGIITIDAVLAGVLFVTIYLRAPIGGLYIAIDGDSGTERWRYYVQTNLSRGYVNSVSDVSDGLVFGSAMFYGDGGESEEQFLAIDAENGEVRWSMVGTVSLATSMENSMVFVQEADHIIAVDRSSGTERWHLSTEGEVGAMEEVAGLLFVSVYSDESDDYSISAVDNETGEHLWSRLSDGDFLTWEITNGIGYFTAWTEGDYVFYALDMETGNELWYFPANYGGNVIWFKVDGDSIFLGVRGILYALGNIDLAEILLASDTIIRAAPSSTAVERGSGSAGDVVTSVGSREEREGQTWVEVTINDVTGWIPLDAIDLATLPPEGEIEYVYIPE